MDKKKIAVIGVGGISECHIAGYKQNPNAELVAFCDINETRLREKGAKHGVTNLFTDVHQMLAAMPEIDAVSVCYNQQWIKGCGTGNFQKMQENRVLRIL